MAQKDITHGMSRTKEYKTWCDMKARCYCRTNTSYPVYGARGILVCDEWKTSFENFFKDMGPKPKGKSLDRIDSSKNYSADNCRWTDSRIQNINRIKRKQTSQRFKGVRLDARFKTIRYEAYIISNKKRYYLGMFNTEIEAAKKYNEAALRLHGPEAILNKIGEH